MLNNNKQQKKTKKYKIILIISCVLAVSICSLILGISGGMFSPMKALAKITISNNPWPFYYNQTLEDIKLCSLTNTEKTDFRDCTESNYTEQKICTREVVKGELFYIEGLSGIENDPGTYRDFSSYEPHISYRYVYVESVESTDPPIYTKGYIPQNEWKTLYYNNSEAVLNINLSEGSEGYIYIYVDAFVNPYSGDDVNYHLNSSNMQCVKIKVKEATSNQITAKNNNTDINTKVVQKDDCIMLTNKSLEAGTILYALVPSNEASDDNLNLEIVKDVELVTELNEQRTEESLQWFGENSEHDNYIYYNSVWYKTNIQFYEYAPDVLPQITDYCGYTIYYLFAKEGYGLSPIRKTDFLYEARDELDSSIVSPSTITLEDVGVSPTEINIGSTITIQGKDNNNSQIFYTFESSEPVIRLDENNNPVSANENTNRYDDSIGIRVTSPPADFGTDLYLTVVQVSYNDKGVKTKKDSDLKTYVYHVADRAATKGVLSVPATSSEQLPEVRAGDKIILYCEEQGVKIFYTIDGSEPLLDENGEPQNEQTIEYDSAKGVVVPKASDTILTINAISYKKDYAISNISRLNFKYPNAVSAPYATPASGTVTENTVVTLKSATKGAIIYYEIGYGGAVPADPTTASSVYSEDTPIVINAQTTIKAMSSLNGITSSVNTFNYTLAGKLSVPTPSIASGSVVSKGTILTLSGSSGGTIYYTTDGSAPNDAANKKVMVGSTVILDGELGSVITLKTCSMGTNYSSSEVAAFSYTISSFEGGVFADIATDSTVKNGSNIVLNTDVTGGIIYYTTDGTMPNTGSKMGNVVTVAGEPGGKFNLKAMALSSGSTQTAGAATFNYQIMSKLKKVKSEVPDGARFTKPQAIALSAELGDIYYTTDGTPPTSSSTLYTEAITIDKETEIQAIAVMDGYDDSDPVSFHYGFADKVLTPKATIDSGEVALDTELVLNCTTPNATIYYTTNGTDPDLEDKDYLYTYKEPIVISQAMTYKVMAVCENMENSEILTLRYTVKEPVVVESDTETGTVIEEKETSNRLQSRRTFSDSSGPSFTDVVLKNATYGALVSAEYNTIPENTQLNIEKIQIPDTSRNLVKQRLGEEYDIVASFEVKLLNDGMEVEPEGTIEIGIPIPVAYENSMICIANTQEDGTVEVFETRRSNGIAYAKANHLGVYSIAAPVPRKAKQRPPILYVVLGLSCIGMGVAGVLLVKSARK